MKYQVTLLDNNKIHKAVSCIITIEQKSNFDLTKNEVAKKQLIQRGIQKICAKRYWNSTDLKKFGYLTAKVRLYDEEKIKIENVERYEKIKAEKYASGEWKKPKSALRKEALQALRDRAKETE